MGQRAFRSAKRASVRAKFSKSGVVGMRKVLLVLIDGLADVSLLQLGNKTPLETAHTPYLDAIAASGLNGLMDPVQPGLACGSDTAHLSILGYDPEKYYRGRGAFESLGAGLEMEDGDVGFKCNFALVDRTTGIVIKRRADRNFELIGPCLCSDLDGLQLEKFPEITIRVKYATEHRCGIVLHGPGLTDNISGTDPLKDGLPLGTAKALDATIEADYTARVVNAASDHIRRVLEQHPINAQRRQAGLTPANVILFRGAGQKMKAPRFEEHNGMKGCVLAPTKIIAGLGLCLGLDLIEAPGATGSYDSLLSAKAEAICHALNKQNYDFGFLHIKAVDDAGHDRDVYLKVKLLEQVDRMIAQIIKRLWTECPADRPAPVLIVTGDHSTPASFGDHSNEPVPIAVSVLSKTVEVIGEREVHQIDETEELKASGTNHPATMAFLWPDLSSINKSKNTFGDRVVAFDEISAAKGALGRFSGNQMMPLIHQFRQPRS